MFKLSEKSLGLVKKELARYETVRSAILPCLFIAQKENDGWVSPEAVTHLAEVMQVPEAQINEVLTFYTMYNKKPVGKNHVQVCTTLSCAMNGARELADHLCRSLNVKYDEVTRDGRFTVSRVECLGSCGTAPMMQVGDQYYENLTPEKALELVKKLE
jgi:NADH-quinone oxidoreductase subunit E